MIDPLKGRHGLRISYRHPLSRGLAELRARHGFIGGVLISFSGEPDYRVSTSSCGSGEFGEEMDRLAAKLLAAIDDGQFDPDDTGEPAK